jgi:hypothetical protein
VKNFSELKSVGWILFYSGATISKYWQSMLKNLKYTQNNGTIRFFLRWNIKKILKNLFRAVKHNFFKFHFIQIVCYTMFTFFGKAGWAQCKKVKFEADLVSRVIRLYLSINLSIYNFTINNYIVKRRCTKKFGVFFLTYFDFCQLLYQPLRRMGQRLCDSKSH